MKLFVSYAYEWGNINGFDNDVIRGYSFPTCYADVHKIENFIEQVSKYSKVTILNIIPLPEESDEK